MNREWIINQLRRIWCKIKSIEAGGTGGGIQSVQPGTNITVDTTDPLNPIVNSTGTSVQDVSATQPGIVNNTSLQELGGVDKLIYGIRIGRGSNSASSCTVFGRNALGKVTTGTNLTAIGANSLVENTTGMYNTGIGDYSLWKNTTGQWNTAIGTSALNSNTTGQRNVALATGLYWNTSGSHNTAIGAAAGYAGTTGNYNSYLGRAAAYTNGIGSFNVALGYLAMSSADGGYGSSGSVENNNNNVFIGSKVRCTSTTSDTLAIDNKGNTPTLAENSLIYGGFAVANRFVKINGRLELLDTAMPTVDVGFTKKLVFNPTTKVVSIKDDITSSTISANKQRFTGDTISAKTLTQTPKANSVSVILNGLELDEQGGDYTVSGTTVTLSNQPLITDVIVIKYLY